MFVRRLVRTFETRPFTTEQRQTKKPATDSFVAAHNTFALLASQPEMGWNPKLRLSDLRGLRLFRVTGFERILILYRPLQDGKEVLRVIHGSRKVQRLLRREGIGS